MLFSIENDKLEKQHYLKMLKKFSVIAEKIC